MTHADTRGRRRRVLACLGLMLLVLGAGSPARAVGSARAPSAHGSSLSCGNNGGGVTVFGFTGGTRLLSETDLQACVTGHLTVTFAGDPATGCATHGLCGYAGTETWQPAGIGELSVSRLQQRGRRYDQGTMFLGGAGIPVQSSVQRSQATGTTTACSDEAQSEAGFFSLPISDGRVTIHLASDDAALLGTRCAGPLDGDIAAALPSRIAALSRILRGHDTIDLTGLRRFAAHGLAGTVDSTIVLTLGRPTHPSTSPASPSPPQDVKPSRVVSVNYRVTHVGGSAVATVRSSPVAAACGPFDACGLQGTIDVTPGATSTGSAGLVATASVRRPKRDLLAALGIGRRGNPAGIALEGGGVVESHGEVTADLTQPSGGCADQAGLRQLVLELDKRANRLQVSLSPGTDQTDPLRTRCPGPELGSQQQLSTASLPLTVLRRPTFTVKLHGVSFSNGPYRVTTRSTLTVTLHRTTVRTRILP